MTANLSKTRRSGTILQRSAHGAKPPAYDCYLRMAVARVLVFVFFDANSGRRVSLDHGRAFGPRRRQPDYIARSDRCDVRRLVEIHYDASREAKRSVPAASQ